MFLVCEWFPGVSSLGYSRAMWTQSCVLSSEMALLAQGVAPVTLCAPSSLTHSMNLTSHIPGFQFSTPIQRPWSCWVSPRSVQPSW